MLSQNVLFSYSKFVFFSASYSTFKTNKQTNKNNKNNNKRKNIYKKGRIQKKTLFQQLLH
jgi:hypothetical protein